MTFFLDCSILFDFTVPPVLRPFYTLSFSITVRQLRVLRVTDELHDRSSAHTEIHARACIANRLTAKRKRRMINRDPMATSKRRVDRDETLLPFAAIETMQLCSARGLELQNAGSTGLYTLLFLPRVSSSFFVDSHRLVSVAPRLLYSSSSSFSSHRLLLFHPSH